MVQHEKMYLHIVIITQSPIVVPYPFLGGEKSFNFKRQINTNKIVLIWKTAMLRC